MERELLGIERFTTNLDWANCWEHFRAELNKMMIELGSELKVFYEEQDLAVILGSWNPSGLNVAHSPSFLLKPEEKEELSIHIEPDNQIEATTSLPPGLPIAVSPVKSAEKKYKEHHDQGFKNEPGIKHKIPSLEDLPAPPREELAPTTPASPPPLPPRNIPKLQPRQDRPGCSASSDVSFVALRRVLLHSFYVSLQLQSIETFNVRESLFGCTWCSTLRVGRVGLWRSPPV